MAFNETIIERKRNGPTLAPFVLVARARAERQLASCRYWLGNDGARSVLRQTVSQAVHSTEQPPATDTGLLNSQFHGKASSDRQFLERSARRCSLK